MFLIIIVLFCFFFQAEDGIRDIGVTGVQTCALPIYVHPAVADDPPARDPAEAEPAARRDPRQAAGRRRRLDRPRQHPAGAHPDAARGGSGRGARAHLVPAGQVAMLLRHRLRQPRGADRQRSGRRGRAGVDQRRLAGLRLGAEPHRGDRAAGQPAVHRVLHRLVPDPAGRGRRARQARPGDAPAVRGARRDRLDRAAGRQRRRAGWRGRRAAPAVTEPSSRFTYASSGVDIDAGERAVDLMRAAVARTNRPEVVGGLGGFAGLFALDVAKYRRPLLASSTDGVGTKIALARALDRHDTVGIDLVAMVVDDLVACGAEPLFLQDYVACGRVVPERIAAIVTGIAAGCTLAGAALVGGETAEHGDLMGADDYDLAATAVGVVEADAVLGPERVRDGDAVVAMASSGFHSNGYSLVRRVVAAAGLDLTATPEGLDRPLGQVLLDRKSTRLNSSHANISYAVFCLKKKT